MKVNASAADLIQIKLPELKIHLLILMVFSGFEKEHK